MLLQGVSLGFRTGWELTKWFIMSSVLYLDPHKARSRLGCWIRILKRFFKWGLKKEQYEELCEGPDFFLINTGSLLFRAKTCQYRAHFYRFNRKIRSIAAIHIKLIWDKKNFRETFTIPVKNQHVNRADKEKFGVLKNTVSVADL